MSIQFINNGTGGSISFINNGIGSINFINSLTSSQIPVSGLPWQQIDTIVSYLRGYISDFRNPQFFTYRLDGNQFQILDGGQDMFDQGNSTIPWLRANTVYWNPGSATFTGPPAISYASQSSTLTDTNLYYAAFGYTQSAGSFPAAQSNIYHPLTLFSARSGSGPIGWQKTGNIGADGAGSILTGSIYTGSVINGFTTYAYFRQT